MRLFKPEFRYTLLFIAIVASLTLGAVSGGSDGGPSIFGLAFSAMLIVAVYAVSGTKRSLYIALAIAIPSIAIHWLMYGLRARPLPLQWLDHLLAITFLSFVSVMLLRAVFRSGTVSMDSVMGAASVYLLMGLLWSLGYSLVEVTTPGAFSIDPSHAAALSGADNEAALQPGDLVYGRPAFSLTTYYSFVTLTTLGYGDIHPIHPVARTLAVLEAVAGQLYLTILIAGLVGVHISRRLAPDASSDPSPTQSR